MGGILGFIGYIFGVSINSEYSSLFAIVLFILGFVLGLIFVRRSNKWKRITGGLLVVLVMTIILLGGYLLIGWLGWLPWWLGGVPA